MSAPLPPARRQRKNLIGYVLASLTLGTVAATVLYGNLADSLVYFVTPTEYQSASVTYANKTLRLGGLVKAPRYDPQTQLLHFTITDGTAAYPVQYVGAVPDLFGADNGVVVEGQFRGDEFHAHALLVKHSEEYRAPEQTTAGLTSARPTSNSTGRNAWTSP